MRCCFTPACPALPCVQLAEQHAREVAVTTAQVAELTGRLASSHSYILALETEVDEMRSDRVAMLAKLSCGDDPYSPKAQANGEFVERLKVRCLPALMDGDGWIMMKDDVT